MYIDGLVFGLLDTSGRLPDGRLAEKLRHFTIAWSRFGYHDTILEDASLDALLRKARGQGYRYCLVQSHGHVIGETWIPAHWEQVDFQTALTRWIADHDFLVTGTILDGGDGAFGLDDACLLVNLEHYAALDTPSFGDPETQAVDVVLPRVHTEAAGDADRIQALGPGPETVSVVPRLAGWNLIDASLRNGLTVFNFDRAIDGHRIVLSDPSPRTMDAFTGLLDTELAGFSPSDPDSALSSGQRRFLGAIDAQVKGSRNGIFLFNLESYADVVDPPADFRPPLTSLYSVAAGFKPNRILAALGCDAGTRVVYFDYSPTALEIRKYLVAEWDGEDFPRFVRHLMQRFPPRDVFYQLWADLSAEDIAWRDLEQLWQTEIEKWGGEAVILEHWRGYRELPHEYVHCNLLRDRDDLLAAIDDRPNAAIWWSNAFFTVYSNWLYTTEERKRIYDGWIEALAGRNPGIYLYGSDFNNINVNHIRAGEYLERYRAECGDYLRPCRLYRHEIRL